jgi:hypothetical protein
MKADEGHSCCDFCWPRHGHLVAQILVIGHSSPKRMTDSLTFIGSSNSYAHYDPVEQTVYNENPTDRHTYTQTYLHRPR